MRVRDPAFLTATVMMVVCALAIVRGWELIHFSLENLRSPGASRGEAVKSWADTTGLAHYSREAQIRAASPADQTALAKLRDDVVNVLAITPLSSKHWLTLASLELAMGRPEKASRALAMSAVTGPNEGDIMARRSAVGVSLWSTLLPEARQQIIADIGGARRTADEAAQLTIAIVRQPEPIRLQIAAALLAAGELPIDQFASYGLPLERPAPEVARPDPRS